MSIPVAKSSLEGVEESLRWWVWETASRNGLELVDSLVIRRSGETWVVDLTNLPIWTLPEEDHAFQVGRTFPDSIRIDGAGICGDLPEDVPPWLDRVAPGWRARQACGGAAEGARLRRWMAAESGKVVAQRVRLQGKDGPIEDLVLSCSGSKELNVGRLAGFRSLRSVELQGCHLSQKEEFGSSTMVQYMLKYLPVRKFVLRDVYAPRLNFRSMPQVDSLEIRGGDISWLDLPARCPEGEEDCPEELRVYPDWIILRDVPIVHPRQIEQIGPIADSFDGPELTAEEYQVIETSRAVVGDFFEISSEWTSDLLVVNPTPFPEDRLPTHTSIKDLRARGVVPGVFSCVRTDNYLGEVYMVGPFATWTGEEGLVLVGDFGSVAGLEPGMSQSEVEEAFPGAILSVPSHTVWANAFRIQLVAVFEADALAALYLPQGCKAMWTFTEIRGRKPQEAEEGD
ncbi:MAG: hypothetical protein H6686_12635 [Fibrobacteria bacterium]|nr:hypothetical protein [Fibrobacteria bacterium]